MLKPLLRCFLNVNTIVLPFVFSIPASSFSFVMCSPCHLYFSIFSSKQTPVLDFPMIPFRISLQAAF